MHPCYAMDTSDKITSGDTYVPCYAIYTNYKTTTGHTYVPCYVMDTAYNIAIGEKYVAYVTTWILIKISHPVTRIYVH